MAAVSCPVTVSPELQQLCRLGFSVLTVLHSSLTPQPPHSSLMGAHFTLPWGRRADLSSVILQRGVPCGQRL